MAEPLVSITIPTKNAEKTLGLCLEAVKNQTYPNIETIVIDSYSTDKTLDIAKKHGVKIVMCRGGLLEARFLGLKESKGKYVVFVDSDQILRETAIERAVKLAENGNYDMVILEEESWPFSRGFIATLYKASKKVINAKAEDPKALKPGEGFFVPRFFRREILERVFEAIPREIIPKIIHYDHDIIYYECYRLSRRIGFLRDGVYHIEPDFKKLLRTNLRYGASMKVFSRLGYYKDLIRKGESRIYVGRPLKLGFQSLILSLILKIVQRIGYLLPNPPN